MYMSRIHEAAEAPPQPYLSPYLITWSGLISDTPQSQDKMFSDALTAPLPLINVVKA